MQVFIHYLRILALFTFIKDPAIHRSHIFNLEILVKIVLQYQEQLSKIADEIDALAKEIEERLIETNC